MLLTRLPQPRRRVAPIARRPRSAPGASASDPVTAAVRRLARQARRRRSRRRPLCGRGAVREHALVGRRRPDRGAPSTTRWRPARAARVGHADQLPGSDRGDRPGDRRQLPREHRPVARRAAGGCRAGQRAGRAHVRGPARPHRRLLAPQREHPGRRRRHARHPRHDRDRAHPRGHRGRSGRRRALARLRARRELADLERPRGDRPRGRRRERPEHRPGRRGRRVRRSGRGRAGHRDRPRRACACAPTSPSASAT